MNRWAGVLGIWVLLAGGALAAPPNGEDGPALGEDRTEQQQIESGA